MIDFAYTDGDSILHRMDPSLKFIVLIFSSILILAVKDIPGLIISILLIGTGITLSGLPIKIILFPLKKLAPFFIFIFFMNVLFGKADNCLFSAGIICISKAGLRQSFNILQHTMAVMILSFLLIRTTTSSRSANS